MADRARQDMTTGEARPIVIGTLPAVGYYHAGADSWSDFRTAHFWLGASVPDAAPTGEGEAWRRGWEAARQAVLRELRWGFSDDVLANLEGLMSDLRRVDPVGFRSAARIRDAIAATIRSMEAPHD